MIIKGDQRDLEIRYGLQLYIQLSEVIGIKMSSEEQPIIEDEPLKVLGLFHKRDTTTITFDSDKFLKLYDSLCCTICRQLFNNPVYLRCSHRFCKQCIEKYIRFNDKKSCPNCRGDLNTKRDLRNDYSLKTLISYAYGDRQKFIEDMTQIENAEMISLQRSNSKSSALIRTKSFAEEQQKAVKKKVKVSQVINVDDITQQKPKRRKSNTNSKSFESSKNIEDSRTEEIRNEIYENTVGQKQQKSFDDQLSTVKIEKIQLEKSAQQFQDPTNPPEPQIVKQKRKRGRKRQIPIIEVKSQSSQQNPQPLESIPMDIQEKIQPAKKQYRAQSFSNIREKPSDKNIYETNELRWDSFEKERNLLREEFGENYMLSLMKVPTFDFIIQIKLQKHPDCFLTPPIPCKSIQLSSKTKLHNVFVLMSKMLNLPFKNIKLFANSSKITPLPYYMYKETSMGQINQKVWKSSSDVQVFDMKQILASLDDMRCDMSKDQQSTQKINKIKLFEGIEFQRQTRSSQPRKRGRGRSKKPEDKQNIHDSKDQLRRVLYYRIVLQ